MGVNKSKPHVYLIPEDEKNRQLANGFQLETSPDKFRQLQILDPPGGWRKVVDEFLGNHPGPMERFPNRFVVLLIDFDGDDGRRAYVRSKIPASMSDRVFVIGTKDDPETFLKSIAEKAETAGRRLAIDCKDGTNVLWGHDQLEDNFSEIQRLIDAGVLEVIF